MKTFACLFLSVASMKAQAAWQPASCPADLARARTAVIAADQGGVASPERENARLDLLEIRFNCRELEADDYCRQAIPLAAVAVRGALANPAISPDVLLKCQLRNGRIGEMCRAPGHR